MARYINVCLIFFGMGILFVGLSNLVHAEDKCGVIAEKLVKPDAAGTEFKVPKTRLKGVKLSVEQSAIELQMVKLHYAKRADDVYSDLGTLQPGEQTRVLDAPGKKRVKLKGVTVQYTIPDENSQGALIKVWVCK